MTVPILALPQRCATCEHQHAGAMASTAAYPPCPRCGCTDFQLHPEELLAGEADDALAAAYYPHGRALDAELARGLAETVTMLEAQMAQHGWDLPPAVGTLHLKQCRDEAGEEVRFGDAYGFGILSVGIDLRHHSLLALTEGNPNIFVPVLADMAEQRPRMFDTYRAGAGGVDPCAPVLAWWVTWEAWVRGDDGPDGPDLTRSARDHPELAVDQCRTLICIDVDERVYEVNRLESAGVTRSVEPWPLFAARVTGRSPAEAGCVSMTEDLPPALDGLVRLVRYTRLEAQTRGAVTGDGGSP